MNKIALATALFLLIMTTIGTVDASTDHTQTNLQSLLQDNLVYLDGSDDKGDKKCKKKDKKCKKDKKKDKKCKKKNKKCNNDDKPGPPKGSPGDCSKDRAEKDC